MAFLNLRAVCWSNAASMKREALSLRDTACAGECERLTRTSYTLDTSAANSKQD
jgi:hypothetical protein